MKNMLTDVHPAFWITLTIMAIVMGWNDLIMLRITNICWGIVVCILQICFYTGYVKKFSNKNG